MNYPIKTNKIEYSLNKEMVNEDFDIYRIKTTEKFFTQGAYILDAPLGKHNAQAVVFEKSSSFLVLMNKNEKNKKALTEALSKADDYEHITLHEVSLIDISDSLLLQLLLNSLSNFKSEELSFNNLTGHFYCFHPKWLKHKKINGVSEIAQVPCMEIKITSDYRLKFPVATFTSEHLKDYIEFNKKKFHEYPQYVFSSGNSLRRKLAEETETAFIKRQIKGRKVSVPFLEIGSLESFLQSKMGMLNTVLDNFNKKLGKYAFISFQAITDYDSEDYTNTVKKENEYAIKAAINRIPIKIVDEINDDYSQMFCKQIRNTLKEEYDVVATIGKRVSKQHLNIRLIHNKEYYDGEYDPHDKEFPEAAVQHITFEDFQADNKYAIKSVVHEVLIKEDIKNGKITLFDWTSLGFTETFTFGTVALIDNHENYIFMEICPDGTFEMNTYEYDLLDESCYSDMILVMGDLIEAGESFRGIIRDSNGNINVIKDTGWFTVPELGKIHFELSRGNTKLRGEEARSELLSACLDIKSFKDKDEMYYFVGIKQKGLRRKIEVAANVRKIEVANGSQSIFNKVLPLMNVSFVHNGQLTIVPFPFKYLREYCNQG